MNCFHYLIDLRYLEPETLHVVNTSMDMPEGVQLSDGDDNNKPFDKDDPHRALDIELDLLVIYSNELLHFN